MYGQPNSPARKKLLTQLFWDAPADIVALEELLQGKTEMVGTISRRRLFQRIAESFSWYAILNMLTLQELKYLLQKEVISGLRSEALRHNYTYAQQRLQSLI